jgi:hypothetical protein
MTSAPATIRAAMSSALTTFRGDGVLIDTYRHGSSGVRNARATLDRSVQELLISNFGRKEQESDPLQGRRDFG